MNIYEEIERYYLNINPAIRTDNFLRRIYAIIAFIGIIVAFFISSLSFNIKYLYLILIIALFLLIVCYLGFILYNSSCKKINFKATSYKDEIKILVDILKKNNVKSQAEIEFILLHFSKNKSISIKNNTFIEFISLTLSISAFFIATYIPKMNIFFSLPLMFVLGISFSIIVFFFNYLINLYNIRDDKFYSEIEQRLTYIYLNFDKYFISSKKIFKPLKNILNKK